MTAVINTWDEGAVTIGDWEDDGTFQVRLSRTGHAGSRSVWMTRAQAERLVSEVAARLAEAPKEAAHG